MNNYYVYILSNKSNKVLYIGVTNDLQRRVYEHKNKLIEGFTSKYNIDKLLHYEITTDIKSAIEREKQLKSWSRAKKEELINRSNPQRNDLSIDWFEK
ncbi:MAG: GIY-YIG nuclease family protein [Christensenellales bacterium]